MKHEEATHNDGRVVLLGDDVRSELYTEYVGLDTD
jgi:hypothetical protein